MRRYLRIKCFLLMLLSICLLSFSILSRADESKKPNIVIVIADDLGWADIGYHGSKIQTPHLDRLAASGVRLEQHYVYPTCSPTRLALLAGRGPSRYGVYGPIAGKSTQHLPLETTTLPKALKKAGFSTHLSGKWHLGLRPEVGPRKYGFDTTYGYLHGQIDPYNHLYKNGDRTWHRNDQLYDEEGHAGDLITAEAVRVIEESTDRPFFLYVAYSVPHFPLREPDRWTKQYDGKIENTWRKQFAASVTHLDDGVGQITAALERAGKSDDTLFIFTSDNGGQKNWNNPGNQYEGRYPAHDVLGDNRPLRGWKGELFEGGVRVPAFAHWPEILPSGSTVDTPLSVLDWMPTICNLAGVEIRKDWRLEGKNIWPQLQGKEIDHSRQIYWNTRNQQALRAGDWKVIAKGKLEKRSWQLFDLQNDPFEKTDLADAHPQKLAQMQKLLNDQQLLDR